MIPYMRNENFIGRDTILDRLLQSIVLEGVGGVGKAEIAIEAAYRVLDKHTHCSDDEADIKEIFKMGLGHANAGSWLLIVDDVDGTDTVLANYLPFSRDASILFTTTSHKANILLPVPLRKIIAVEVMNNTEAADLLSVSLTQRQSCDTVGKKGLNNFLSNLRLAIKMASTFMPQNPNVMVTQYLEIYNSNIISTVELDISPDLLPVTSASYEKWSN
ncbi:P-loop containing nucleoside triphosphate hydrolase protein [Xylaria castorea]|nr:P-loop containing nucleoside triphosphate hydrolase protein [Xylaria castorea]